VTPDGQDSPKYYLRGTITSPLTCGHGRMRRHLHEREDDYIYVCSMTAHPYVSVCITNFFGENIPFQVKARSAVGKGKETFT